MSSLKIKLNFTVPAIIYPFDVMVSLNQTWDEFAKNVVKRFGSEILEDFTKYQHPYTEGLSYIYVSEGQLACILRLHTFDFNNPKHHGTLAHEVFHITEFVLRKVGCSLSEHSNEAYSYFNGYLSEKIYENILKATKRK